MGFFTSRFAGMREFLIIWLGQTLSRVGTYLTGFALSTFWVWEQTETATSIVYVFVANLVGASFMSFFGGALIDRYNRKWVMMGADMGAASITALYLVLFATDNLQIWHLLAGNVVAGAFNNLHGLAFQAATTLMMDKSQYARAGSLRFLTHYGAAIFSPPIAAVLYVQTTLETIMIIDLLTVGFALFTILMVTIPQPAESEAGKESKQSRLQELLFGFRYIRRHPSLMAIMGATALFTFFHDGAMVMHSAMILARTDNDPAALAAIGTAAGIGGLIGSLVMTTWGGGDQHIRTWLLGTMGAGLAKIGMSLATVVTFWVPLQVFSSFNFPLRGGSMQSIQMSKVPADIQGRFFGVMSLVMMITSIIISLILAPFADYVLEPAMTGDTVLADSVGWLFGTSQGSGFAIIYFVGSVGMFLLGLLGFRYRPLADVETLMPDIEQVAKG